MITVANKLGRRESQSGLDEWYKTELDAIHKVSKVQSVYGTEVSVGEVHTVLIPFSDRYRHYRDWTDRNETYTMRVGDIIFFETFDEDITPDNISDLKELYDCCEVKSIDEAEEKYGATIQLKVGGV